MLKIDGVKILELEIKLRGEKTSHDEVNLGALTLHKEGREYILDSKQSYTNVKDGFTLIEVDLEEDREIFNECEYDLKSEDFNENLEGEFFIETDFPVEYITLVVQLENGEIEVINIDEE